MSTRFPLTEQIPKHLELYLSKQDYSLYTPMDHASWRFIMAIARDYYAVHAHQKYLDGLRDTGISTDRIPRIEEMDERLRRFNWRAIPVIGFIPPAAFLEFQSYGLLPIACDMRKVENINYTPAPDIVHEAAGHAPILADPAFSDYLRGYGEVARKAIFSRENMNVYYAIRNLSDTKERPDATEEEIAAADALLEQRLSEVTYDSEVDWVTRLGWWTAEYGLVGPMEDPKIYGAGLLSSIGESYHCLSDKVKHLPLTIQCIHTAFNITEPQPQLFVTPNFEYLTEVLAQLADLMAFRRGGLVGLQVAKRGGTLCTVEYDNGLQVSGVVTDFQRCHCGKPAFIKLTGPTQLAYRDEQLPGHDPTYHNHGYSSPSGTLDAPTKPPAHLTEAEIALLGFKGDAKGKLQFESGITVEGVLTDTVRRDGQLLVMTFRDCTVRDGDTILYNPEWGPFDMACGETVRSVFGGAADRYAYMVATGDTQYDPGIHKTNRTERNAGLMPLYTRVREIRDAGSAQQAADELASIRETLKNDWPHDWLLRWELLELNRDHRLGAPWAGEVEAELESLKSCGAQVKESIERGLRLLQATTR